MQDVLNTTGRVGFARRFVPVFSLFLSIIIISLLLALGAMEVLSAARAYVAGEGLWSKAQRDAVYSLTLYARTREPTHFERYQRALSILVSDQRARLEMDKPDFDYTKAYSGLLGGDNHPDDIPGMIRLYRCCAEYSYFKRSVSIWGEGDTYIAQLKQLGGDLHAVLSSNAPSAKRIEAILVQVHAVDAGVKPLEDAFTATLGEAVRRIRSTLAWAVSATISLLIVLGVYLSARILGQARRTEDNYRLLADAFAHHRRRHHDSGQQAAHRDGQSRVHDHHGLHARGGSRPDVCAAAVGENSRPDDLRRVGGRALHGPLGGRGLERAQER